MSQGPINTGQILTIFMLHFDELEQTKIHTQECLPCRTGVPCKKGTTILRAFQIRHEEVKMLMEDFRRGASVRPGAEENIKPT